MSSVRNWKTALLLSLIIPIGLLATFKITGVVREPATVSETITLEPVKWELERPGGMITIKDTVESFYDDESISLCSSVYLGHYLDFPEHEISPIIMNVTVTLPTGFVNDVNITFWEGYEYSEVGFFEVHAWPKFYSHGENLSIVDYAHHLSGEGLKAFMELAGVNRPKSVHFSGIVHWILGSPIDQTHVMEAAVELVYFNGTVYKRLVQPYQLKVGPDDNNSFETADTIGQGADSWLYLGGYDVEDYYKIHVEQGHVISINVSGTLLPKPAFYLDLYDPAGEWKAGSSRWDYSHTVTYVADSAGDWFIRTRVYENYGFYSLAVNTYLPGG